MSNQVIERRPNGQFSKGSSGNIRGNAQRTRHLFSKAFVEALLEDFREWGAEAIVRVRTETRASDLYDRARVSWRILAASTQLVYAKTLLKRRLESAMNSILAHCKNGVCHKSC